MNLARRCGSQEAQEICLPDHLRVGPQALVVCGLNKLMNIDTGRAR